MIKKVDISYIDMYTQISNNNDDNNNAVILTMIIIKFL